MTPDEIETGSPDNPTEQPPAPAAVNMVTADHQNLVDQFEKLKEDHDEEKRAHSETADLLNEAIRDNAAFIHQLDRQGLGMQTVCDHRVRVDKFTEKLKKLGRV